MNRLVSIKLLIFVTIIFCLSGCGYQRSSVKSFTSVNVEPSIPLEASTKQKSEQNKFIYTTQEEKEINKWKDKTVEDLQNDAAFCDSAALHNLGGAFLYGIYYPVNVEVANEFFAESASLGFAPSLHQLSLMYLEDESNVFLAMVYINLTIAFGHPEFTVGYHEFRNDVMQSLGVQMMKEVERLANHKMRIILDNQSGLEKASDKSLWRTSMKNIVDEDIEHGHQYWAKFCKSKDIAAESKPWYLRIDSLNVNNDLKEFLKLVADISFRIPKSLKNEISEDDVKNYLVNNVPEMIGTKEGRLEVLETLERLRSIPIMKGDLLKSTISENPHISLCEIEGLIDKRLGSIIKQRVNAFKANIKY